MNGEKGSIDVNAAVSNVFWNQLNTINSKTYRTQTSLVKMYIAADTTIWNLTITGKKKNRAGITFI